jgi:hypothetical protein
MINVFFVAWGGVLSLLNPLRGLAPYCITSGFGPLIKIEDEIVSNYILL